MKTIMYSKFKLCFELYFECNRFNCFRIQIYNNNITKAYIIIIITFIRPTRIAMDLMSEYFFLIG